MESFGILMERFLSRFAYYDSPGNRYSNKAKRIDYLGLLLNSHYLDTTPDGHFSEYREERIVEFLEVNRDVVVAGLREGMMFRIEDNQIKHEGVSGKTCRIFKYGQSPLELGSNDNFSFLLKK